MQSRSLFAVVFFGLLACPLAGQNAHTLHREACERGELPSCKPGSAIADEERSDA